MGDGKLRKRGGSQGVGQEIVKIAETNKLVRWKALNPKTREYEIELPDGIVTMHESKITKEFTLQEELDFLRNERTEA